MFCKRLSLLYASRVFPLCLSFIYNSKKTYGFVVVFQNIRIYFSFENKIKVFCSVIMENFFI